MENVLHNQNSAPDRARELLRLPIVGDPILEAGSRIWDIPIADPVIIAGSVHDLILNQILHAPGIDVIGAVATNTGDKPTIQLVNPSIPGIPDSIWVFVAPSQPIDVHHWPIMQLRPLARSLYQRLINGIGYGYDGGIAIPTQDQAGFSQIYCDAANPLSLNASLDIVSQRYHAFPLTYPEIIFNQEVAGLRQASGQDQLLSPFAELNGREPDRISAGTERRAIMSVATRVRICPSHELARLAHALYAGKILTEAACQNIFCQNLMPPMPYRDRNYQYSRLGAEIEEQPLRNFEAYLAESRQR